MADLWPIPTRTEVLLDSEGRGFAAGIRTYANAFAQALEDEAPVQAWNAFLNLLIWVDIAKRRLRVDVKTEG